MPEGPSVGTAFLSVKPDMSSLTSQMGAYFGGSRWAKLGKVAGVGLAAGLAAGGAAKALFEIGEAFDKASDKIRVGTGKTGKDLKKLEGDFKAVVKSVPADFDTASSAISDLNTRLGLSGKPLREMSRQFTELSRITDTDVQSNIKTVTRAFGDWAIKTKDQADALDFLFRASQASGSTVQELSELVVQFGAPLRQVGFTFEESASMFASFEKAGVNIQTMMPGLKFALKKFLTEDIDPKKGLEDTFKGIEDGTIKASDALDIFGQRAGADMVEAIKQGRFEFEDFTKTIEKGDDTIRQAGKETMDFAQHWQRFKNNVLVTLEPVAKRVFNAVGKAMKAVTDVIGDKNLSGGEKADALLEMVSNAISDALPKLAEAGKKAAVAIIKGLLDAGTWGKIALGAVIFKALGSSAVFSAATTAGTSVGARFSAGLKAGLARAGIAAALVAVFAAINRSTGPSIGEMLAKGIEENFVPKMRKAAQRGAVRPLRRMTEEAEIAADGFRQIGDVGSAEFDKAADAAEDFSDRSAGALGNTMEKLRQLRDSIRRLRIGFHGNLGSITDDVDRNMERIKNTFGAKSEQGMKLLDKNYTAAITAIRKAMKEGRIGTDKGMDKINEILRARLSVFGIEGADAEKIIKAKSGNATGLQHGGAIVPGVGSGDKVPLHLAGKHVANVEPGELVSVANRTATAALMDVNAQVKRGLAKGGIVGLGRKLQKQGFHVAEHPAFGGVAGVHAPGSYHYSGQALDINADHFPGGEMSALDRLHSRLKNLPGVIELLWRVADHFDHLHVAMAKGATEGFLGGRFRLPRFIGKFAQGKAGAAGLNNASRGLEEIIGKRLGSVEGAEPSSFGGGMSKSQIANVWKQANNFGNPGLMAAIALAESSGVPSAVGHDPGGTQGLGLWQITTGFNNDLIRKYGGRNAMFNPVANAKAAGDILQRQGLGAWVVYNTGAHRQFLQQGGMVMPPFGGSFANGGTVPGPVGAPRTIVAHGGEQVGNPQVRVFIGERELTDIVHTEVMDASPEVAEYTMRQGGRNRSRGRQLSGRR